MAAEDTFNQPGAIVRIRLCNFMTYNDQTIYPGANLNMVIAPNGTGKSAIVCAIIVGLAGEVSTTGRANNISSLVQRGHDSGSTEIELYNDDEGQNHVIKRKIIIVSRERTKIETKNEWSLNGTVVTKKVIQELMTHLNIKVDNLCQFLPQDSVASFVKMNSSELLISTLKAAGDNQLVTCLDRLDELTRVILTEQRQLTELEKESAQNEVNARRLESEVEELREREKLIKLQKICSQKIHFVRHEEAQTNCDRAKDALKEKEEELRQRKGCGDPFKQKAESYKKEESRLREATNVAADETKKALELIGKNKENLENRKLECQDKFANFKRKKDQEEQRAQQIRIRQQELDSCECRLNDIREVNYEKDITTMRGKAKEVQIKVVRKNEEKQRLDHRKRDLIIKLDEMQNKRAEILGIKEKRLNYISDRKRDIKRVVEWLAKNRDKFQKEVLMPLFCELDIKDSRYADYVEFVINEQDFYAFICQTERDLTVFTEHTHNVLKARINVILQPDKTVAEFEAEASQRRNPFSRMDFIGFLKDMVDAPEPIMRYLCGQYHFHKLPLFGNLSETDLAQLMNSNEYPRFFTKKLAYMISKSRYDGEKMVYNDTVRDARMLKNFSQNKDRVAELDRSIESLVQQRTQLEEESTATNQELQELQQEFVQLSQRVNDLLLKQNEKTQILNQIRRCKEKLEELQSEKIDIEAEKVKLQQFIKNINLKSITDLERLNKLYEDYSQIRKRFLMNLLLCTLARKNMRIAMSEYEKAMEAAKILEETIPAFKRNILKLEKLVEETKKAAEEKIAGFKNGRLDKETRRKFTTINQNTAESLELYAEELKARITGMSRVASNMLLNDFNRQMELLQDKRKQMAHLESSIAAKSTERQQIRDSFIPKLDDVIRVIDEHYRDFMLKLSYGGKVELARDPQNPDDFSKYGINIMVKYRDNEELIPLSSTRQSGGERSVATMIYMLALQTKTSVPFRVVDEINQGMDKDNERKVFELLVQTAEESSSQYFLVSPKLLPNLQYGERMKIHIIYNGPQLQCSLDDLI